MSHGSVRSIADRLLHLAETRATGVLALARGQVRKRLFLRDGLLVAAESDLREEALGEVLVALGILGKSRLPQLLAEVRRRGQKMGAVLVDLGWASADDVLAALGEQVRRRARSCLRWLETEGEFTTSTAFVGHVIEYASPVAPLVFTGLRESASFELLLPMLEVERPRYVTLRRRFERHREAFVAVFGPLLPAQIAAGRAISDLVVHPEAPVIIEAIEALIASGLGAIEEAGQKLALPAAAAGLAPSPVHARVFANAEGPAVVDRLGAELAFQLGRAAFLAGQPRAALEHLRRAVELRPDQAAYHAWLGSTQFRLQGAAALPEALDRLEHAVAVDPDSADAHGLLAEIVHALGDGARARIHFERTLALRPEQGDVIETLAELYLGAGEIEETERLYRRVLAAIGERASPLRAQLWQRLAALYEGPLADPAGAARAHAMIAQSPFVDATET